MEGKENMMVEEIIESSENEEVITSGEDPIIEKASESGEGMGAAVPGPAAAQEKAPKTFTQEELNGIMQRKDAQHKRKLQKALEAERAKTGDLMSVLKAATGEEDVEAITERFRSHCQKSGIHVPEKKAPSYTDRELQILAKADAEDIIGDGIEAVIEETDRLAALGLAKMTPREKVLFRILAEERGTAERKAALAEIGVGEDIAGSQEFLDFSKKFVKGTPPGEIYDLYQKMQQPKKNIKPIGSIANSVPDSAGVKEYYTPEEAKKFTQKEIDSNPSLFRAIVNSMHKWKK